MRAKRNAGRRRRGGPCLAGSVLAVLVILMVAPAGVLAASQITGLFIGDQAEAGVNQTTFAPTAAAIKGIASIAGAPKGTQVTADLIYVTQNLKALSTTKDAPESGDFNFTFTFSKPTNNWPLGDYKVVISTSDGAIKEVAFQVK